MDISLLKGGLIVSCQALENEPLHSSFIMQKMATAAQMGGAVAIRANSAEDIREIKKACPLPLIGLIKQEYEHSPVYITPTMEEVDALVACGADIIAMDATARPRPGQKTLEDFFAQVRTKYPQNLFMADCATLQDCVLAEKLGFDLIGTTLRGYTEDTKHCVLPDISFMRQVVAAVQKPVIAEGGIWTPQQLAEIMQTGVYAAVVGTAITRPMEITRRFTAVLSR